MRSFRFIPLLLWLLPALPVLAQYDKEELLEWTEDRKLSWADYKAPPDRYSDAAASTTTYLVIDYCIGHNSFTYKIESRFSKTRSWGLYQTEYILAHEQGHFDIAEVYARKLNKRMQEYVFNSRTYDRDLKRIYDLTTEEKMKTQDRYDRETNHSINREQQAAWQQKIAAMLKEYEAYAGY